jgi:hypothetical protein
VTSGFYVRGRWYDTQKGNSMFAYDYPLLGFFWSMVIFFLWFMWLWLLFRIFADIFRSADLGGFAKTLWIIFVIVLPFLGVFIYVIARGNSMTQRSIDLAEQQRAQFDSYVREAAGSSSASTADELAKFSALKQQGVISDAEFAAAKARLLTT